MTTINEVSDSNEDTDDLRARNVATAKWLLRCTTLAFIIVFTLLTPHASAHSLGWSYIFIDIADNGISGRFELPLDRLIKVIELDVDRDNRVSEKELASAWTTIEQYARSVTRLGHNGLAYPLVFTSHDRLDTKTTSYAVLNFSLTTPSPVPLELEARFAPFFEVDEVHRGGLVMVNNVITGERNNDSWIAFIFSEERDEGTVDLRGETRLQNGVRFTAEGLHHILNGFDHVLFLITLLLTAVMTANRNQWEPVLEFRSAFLNLVAIVTLFTIAHSITLLLASRGWVSMPSRLVESIIALSVLIVALNNLYPVLKKHIWPLVFCFGLFHGLGFASALQEILITGRYKLTSLIGFNVGVELAQLAIVIVTFPILYLCRETALYRRLILPGVSGGVSLLAMWWLLTRAFGFESYITSF